MAARGRPGDQDRIDACVERAALQAQREIGALALRDVGIRAEHADHLPVAVRERDLARDPRPMYAVDRDVQFEVHLRHAGRDHFPIDRAQHVGHVAPRQVEIGLAENLLGVRQAGVARERQVAAEIARLAILPENALRDVVDHRLEHLVRALRFGFGVDLVGHVIGEDEHRRTPHERERVDRNVRAQH